MSNNKCEDVYQDLEDSVISQAQDVGVQHVGDNFVENFFLKMIPSHCLSKENWKDFARKQYHLEYAQKQRPKLGRRKTKKLLTSEEKKRLRIFNFDKNIFDSYKPLYHLWKSYMKEILNLQHCKDIQGLSVKTFKADYHGCYMTVTKSKNYSLIGQKGIVLMETKNAFKMVTPANKMLIIPKKNSVFTFKFDGYYFTIYGSNFLQHPVHRIKGKFKMKTTTDL